jgi:hypothetical protein
MKNSTQIIAQHKNESMSETMKKNSREYKLLKEKVIELGEGGSNETNAIQIASRIICKVQA